MSVTGSRPGAGPALARIGRAELLDFDLAAGPGAGAVRGAQLLLHGFADDKASLRELADALRAPGEVAVLPSLRAHGQSPAPAWGYSPLDFGADLHRIADVLPGPAHVIGYSFGALIGAVTALLLGPSRVSTVTVLDQSFDRMPERFVDDGWAEASFLKWHYSYAHVYDGLRAMGIPVHVVFARDSHVVPEQERASLLARVGPRFHCAVVDGTHAGLIRDTGRLAGVLSPFYERYHVENVSLEALS
ncbi:alpha/beta fold hydrolase [Mangrovihabitans endophyticus]|uniref:AB hydrolase-1 domain-containing protein n=1 Tax=Mangrovihabitans endophyticus TaxID=1751298 RepID=A0A8J3FME6_9ACTN|nr:alpha/beta fold hydrolase [Mangrovihabitans endophyticus]GGK78879.1 hypothetical protein GCM10012284_11000 [Mangrovihabitans endophyticus]